MLLDFGLGDLPHLLGRCLGFASAVGVVAFFYRMYQMRMVTIRVARQGVPMLPHSFFFGHLLTVAKVVIKHKEIPSDLHEHWLTFMIRLDYPEIYDTGVVYLDTWPIGFPMMMIVHPDLVAQMAVSPSLPKHHWLGQGQFYPFSGAVDLLTANGAVWKEQRVIYNQGFSARNIVAMTEWILEEVLVFRQRLLKIADTQETIKLEEYTTDLTLDIIMRAVFNVRLKNQELPMTLWIDCVRKQADLLHFTLNLQRQFSPIVHFKHWRYSNIIRKAIEPLVEHAKHNDSQQDDGPKAIVGQAVSQFKDRKASIPPEVMDKMVKNIKIFIYAGHDTTSVAFSAALYRLHGNPDKLALLREELDRVLGPDPSKAADAIRADFAILNRLPYATAVIKETLRLHPPAGGGIRQPTSPDFELVHPGTGMRFPTNGFALHNNANALHLDHELWPHPTEFIPERFLTRDPDDPLYPVKYAWQPFGIGPRACIGQELVYVELKLAMAFTVREIEVVPHYPEDAPTFLGQKAYQTMVNGNIAVSRAKDLLPVRIKKRVL